MGNQKNDILKDTLMVFEERTTLQLVITQLTPDCLLKLKHDNIELFFMAEIKPSLSNIASSTHLLKQGSVPGLLITNYVNPNMAERLKKQNVNFLDTVGNAYINAPPLFIYIKGNKAPALLSPSTAFSTAGIKLIFLFLCSSKSLNASYREIANNANVGLGTITNVLNDLKQKGYLIHRGKKGKTLRNVENLIDEWAKAYHQKLRRKLILGKYKTNDPLWWKRKKSSFPMLNTLLGGESAAEKLTKYLKPEIMTFYTQEKPAIFQLNYHLESVANGNIELLQKFWHFKDEWEEKGLVPPLLVYADLIASGDPRNLETAKMIYEQELDRYIKNFGQ